MKKGSDREEGVEKDDPYEYSTRKNLKNLDAEWKRKKTARLKKRVKAIILLYGSADGRKSLQSE